MATTEENSVPISPRQTLAEIAQSIPDDCRQYMIIIGSLAVGYRYFGSDSEMVVRTKDADCLLSPHLQAISTGIAVTDRLFEQDWSFRPDEEWPTPGNAQTPDDKLPAVRLLPPGRSDWFLELLTVPKTPEDRGQTWERLRTRHGHFGLCSFGFISLANYKPIDTELGIQIARPEMMVLANLLEHPKIGTQTMSGGFAGLDNVKRSNKDLGRVIAIAKLAITESPDVLLDWPAEWEEALRDHFPGEWQELAARVGTGLRQLLASPNDLDQALHTCVNGLLASVPPTETAFRVTGERLLEDAVKPLEQKGRKA